MVAPVDPAGWISSIADRFEKDNSGNKVSELSVRWFAEGEAFTSPPGLFERFRRWIVRTFLKPTQEIEIGSFHFLLKKWDSSSNVSALRSAFDKALETIQNPKNRVQLSKALLFGLKSDELSASKTHGEICHDLLFHWIANKTAHFRCLSPGETFSEYAQKLAETPTEKAFLKFCTAFSLVNEDPSVKELQEVIETEANHLLIILAEEQVSSVNGMSTLISAMQKAGLPFDGSTFDAVVACIRRIGPKSSECPELKKLYDLLEPSITPQQKSKFAETCLEQLAEAAARDFSKTFLETCQTGVDGLTGIPVEAKHFKPIADKLSETWVSECQRMVTGGEAVLARTGISDDSDIQSISAVITKKFPELDARLKSFVTHCPEPTRRGVTSQLKNSVGVGFLPIGIRLLDDLNDTVSKEVDRLVEAREANKSAIETAIRLLEKLLRDLEDVKGVISGNKEAGKKERECAQKIRELIGKLKPSRRMRVPSERRPPLKRPAQREVVREAAVEQAVPQAIPIAQTVQYSLARRVYEAVDPLLRIFLVSGMQSLIAGEGMGNVASKAQSQLIMAMAADAIGRTAAPLFSRVLQSTGLSQLTSSTMARAATSLGIFFGLHRMFLGPEATLLQSAAMGARALVTQEVAGRIRETIQEHAPLPDSLLGDIANTAVGSTATVFTSAGISQAEGALRRGVRLLHVGEAAHGSLEAEAREVHNSTSSILRETVQAQAPTPLENHHVQPLPTPPQIDAVHSLFDLYQRIVPFDQQTGVASVDIARQYERSGMTKPFYNWLQDEVDAQTCPPDQLRNALHTVLGMSWGQVWESLSADSGSVGQVAGAIAGLLSLVNLMNTNEFPSAASSIGEGVQTGFSRAPPSSVSEASSALIEPNIKMEQSL